MDYLAMGHGKMITLFDVLFGIPTVAISIPPWKQQNDVIAARVANTWSLDKNYLTTILTCIQS